MSRAVINSGLFAAVSNGLTQAVSRRSYSAASAASAATQRGGRGAAALLRGEEKAIKKEVGDAASSWVPDPVTGYYRPANRVEEVDVAELRNHLLKIKH